MSDEPRHRPRPRPSGASMAVVVICVVVGVGLLIGAGAGFLSLVNPVGDEWVCAEGEAPAGNGCYPVGSNLPPGVKWHPFGNRPLPENCDKDGWVLIQRTVARRGSSDRIQDCVREGTRLPGRWRLAETD